MMNAQSHKKLVLSNNCLISIYIGDNIQNVVKWINSQKYTYLRELSYKLSNIAQLNDYGYACLIKIYLLDFDFQLPGQGMVENCSVRLHW